MRESSYSEHDETPQYWFNTKTGQVEVGPQSSARYRIGPFETRAEAEDALAQVAKRAAEIKKADAEDDDWN
jgi:hypothetical protein